MAGDHRQRRRSSSESPRTSRRGPLGLPGGGRRGPPAATGSKRTPRRSPRAGRTLGALDVYVLPPQAGTRMIQAQGARVLGGEGGRRGRHRRRRRAACVAPRASSTRSPPWPTDRRLLVVGCGHAADGNVHLSVWQADAEVRHRLLHDIIATGCAMGGAVSGEHGIGEPRRPYFIELEDPVKLALMRRIKEAFDPEGILNPGTIFDPATAVRRRAVGIPMNGAQGLIRTPGRPRGRHLLHEPGHLRDALRRGARRRAGDARRPRAVRGGGHRRGGRVRPGRREACGHACSTSGPAWATASPTCTTPGAPTAPSSTSSATMRSTTAGTTRSSSRTSRPWRATCRRSSSRRSRPRT